MLIKPENTAITRSKPSRPLLKAFDMGWVATWNVLDFGCGKGMDLRHMTEKLNIQAEGHDPAHGFHRTGDKYSTVFLTYVLNALAPDERIKVLQEAWDLVDDNGVLIVSTRRNVDRLAGRKGWTPIFDGYCTNEARGMFQAEVDYDWMDKASGYNGPLRHVHSMKFLNLVDDFYLSRLSKMVTPYGIARSAPTPYPFTNDPSQIGNSDFSSDIWWQNILKYYDVGVE